MQHFDYSRVTTLAEAFGALNHPGTMFVAGGTEIVNWMKEDIVRPARLVDINEIAGLNGMAADEAGIRIGALARMSHVAEHEIIRSRYPAVSQALLKSASPQIRNMASLAGNLMQRTRCPYFRAERQLPCNKRQQGSGCAGRGAEDRTMAIFGWSENCIATHPSDVAVALVALDARLELASSQGRRRIALADFHRLPENRPDLETMLQPGEIITSIDIPATPVARRSHYLKLRERASYEFALISAAVGLELDGGHIREVRVALGGVAAKPWRLFDAERQMQGLAIADRQALRRILDVAFAEARPGQHNGFKIELAKRAVIRALETAGEAP